MNWNRLFIKINWVLLVGSFVAMLVCLCAWFMDAISDRAMLGITLALSWLAIQLGSAGVLVTFYVKDDVET